MMEVGAVSRFMNWGYREIMDMPVRVRRHWVKWSSELQEMEQAAIDKAREEAWARRR